MSSESIELVGLNELLAKIPSDAKRRAIEKRIVDRIVLNFEREIKRHYMDAGIHRRTGASIGSIKSELAVMGSDGQIGGMTGDVDGFRGQHTLGSKVLHWLNDGTGIFGPAHRRIVPVHARAMRWAAGSTRLTGTHRAGATASWVFARSTAGMPARPFFEAAREAGRPFVEETMSKARDEFLMAGGLI